MKIKKTFKKIITNFDAVITGATLTLCVVIANLNVFMRYFLNHPLQWNDEVVTGLFVWTVFIGSAYAYRKHAHLGVDIVVNLMHGKTKAIVQDVISASMCITWSMSAVSISPMFPIYFVSPSGGSALLCLSASASPQSIPSISC